MAKEHGFMLFEQVYCALINKELEGHTEMETESSTL